MVLNVCTPGLWLVMDLKEKLNKPEMIDCCLKVLNGLQLSKQLVFKL